MAGVDLEVRRGLNAIARNPARKPARGACAPSRAVLETVDLPGGNVSKVG